MSRIDDLIDDLIAELCPQGVPVRPLGEVGTFTRGRRFTKADRVDEGIPSVHYGEIYTHYGVSATSAVSHVRSDLAPSLRFAQPGDVIFAGVGETVEDVGKALAWLGTDQVAVHDDCFIFQSPLDPKYVAYFTQTEAFNSPKEKFVARAKVKRLSASGLAMLDIPVPPLEAQREIALILDRFTELKSDLEMNLEAELEARLRQYSFYRDRMLSLGTTEEATRVSLGDIAEFKYGYTSSAQEIGDYRFIRITDINPQGKLSPFGAKYVDASYEANGYLVRPGDLLMARTGATYGKTMLVDSGEPAVYASFLIRIQLDQGVLLPSFYWHFAQSSLYWQQARSMVSSGGQPQFNGNALKRVQVPIPSLEEQSDAVAVLNKFDTMVNDLTSSLPSEVKARRQQYAYYRDRLFTFKEATE